MLVLVSKEPLQTEMEPKQYRFQVLNIILQLLFFLAHLCSKIEIHIFLLIADPSHY